MDIDRRTFVLIAGLGAGGAACGGLQWLAVDQKSISRAEQEVQAVTSHYGERVNHVVSAPAQVTYTIKIHSPNHFARVFNGANGLPFERIYAAGSTLEFKHRGVTFILEHTA